MKKRFFVRFALPVLLSPALAGCIRTQNEVEVKPIEIKPVQINIDMNVKVDKALDEALSQAGTPAAAAPVSEKGRIFASMRRNRERIDELKNAGKIGENNRGLLEFRVPHSETTTAEQLLVAQTNDDRNRLYVIIAEEQKSTADFVASRRSERSREKAGSGQWLQDISGQWYRQP